MTPACLLLLATAAQPAPADHPRVVLLIRHAEKPPDGDPSVGLSDAGTKRAAALAGLFRKSADRPDPLPVPDFLFAAKNTDHSHRSVRTVKPLAQALGLKLHADIANDDYPKVAEELTRPPYAGKVVLVCWHHGNLPGLAQALGATAAPPKWKDTAFDRVWQLTYVVGGAVLFCDRPHRLLPNDQ